MIFFLSFLLILAILLEGTVTTLPLVLIYLLCLAIYKRDAVVFVTAFFAGLVLDLLKLHVVGASSLFFLVFILLILLYQRKYEIHSYPFVIFAGFFGGLVYAWIFGSGNIFTQGLLSALIASIVFALLRLSQNSKVKIQN